MKTKKKSTLTTDIIGILCGVFIVVVGIAMAIAANAGKVAGLSDSEIPDGVPTLVGKAEGRNGEITVQVRADANKIYQIRVLDEQETKGIGSEAVKEIPKAIYDNQSLQVDATSGATITSDAIVKAVYNALDGGKIDPFKFGYRVVKADKIATVVSHGPENQTVQAVSADEWVADYDAWAEQHAYLYASYYAEDYPEIYASLMANEENADHPSYLESFPQLKSLYAGYPFSYDYDEARGHAYVIDDVTETDRLHKKLEDGSLNPEIFQKANCFTCKSPVMSAIVNETNEAAYAWDFATMMTVVTEPVSCYTCHGTQPGEFTVTQTYLAGGVGNDLERIDGATLSCGQCHNEYYFMPGTNATTLPHTSLATMAPAEILNYYNTNTAIFKTEEDGTKVPFYDFVNKISGVKVIKVQHPELETYLGEGSVHRGKFTCADCHMGELPTANGVTKNHTLTSPLDNEALIKSTCSECHTDLKADVQAIQEKTLSRTREVADLLVELHNRIAEAAASGEYTDEELEAIRAVARDAQFYWDFVFVENSNGAHNSKLTYECLDKAQELTEQALGMFK